MKKLVKGTRYNVNSLRLIGWTRGDGSGAEGYSYLDYFSPSGVYQGPDSHRIEPIVESSARTGNPLRKRHGPPKGKVPPQLRRYLFKKGHR